MPPPRDLRDCVYDLLEAVVAHAIEQGYEDDLFDPAGGESLIVVLGYARRSEARQALAVYRASAGVPFCLARQTLDRREAIRLRATGLSWREVTEALGVAPDHWPALAKWVGKNEWRRRSAGHPVRPHNRRQT